MTRIVIAISVGSCLLFPGCTAMRAQPERSGDIATELQQLEQYFAANVLATYNDDTKPEEAKRQYRDEVILGRVRSIDLHFNIFESAVSEESKLLNVGTDWTVIGLSAAGTLVPSAGTKAILAAISGGLVGAKGSVDKHVFYEKTMSVLLAEMRAARRKKMVAIMKGLTQPTTEYPLLKGLVDLEEYFKAGTIDGALTGIAVASGAKAAKADLNLTVLNRIRETTFLLPTQEKAGRALLAFCYDAESKPIPESFEKVRAWLDSNAFAEVTVTDLITSEGQRWTTLRRKVVNGLSLPPIQ